jgi:hypothetical protein
MTNPEEQILEIVVLAVIVVLGVIVVLAVILTSTGFHLKTI